MSYKKIPRTGSRSVAVKRTSRRTNITGAFFQFLPNSPSRHQSTFSPTSQRPISSLTGQRQAMIHQEEEVSQEVVNVQGGRTVPIDTRIVSANACGPWRTRSYCVDTVARHIHVRDSSIVAFDLGSCIARDTSPSRARQQSS